jgi:hypothetical protein
MKKPVIFLLGTLLASACSQQAEELKCPDGYYFDGVDCTDTCQTIIKDGHTYRYSPYGYFYYIPMMSRMGLLSTSTPVQRYYPQSGTTVNTNVGEHTAHVAKQAGVSRYSSKTIRGGFGGHSKSSAS